MILFQVRKTNETLLNTYGMTTKMFRWHGLHTCIHSSKEIFQALFSLVIVGIETQET